MMPAFTRWFTHFSSRRLEWALALYTLGLGLWLILPPVSMASDSTVGALSLMSELQWGCMYTLVGCIHCIALHINGRAAWTPFARLAAVFLNGQVFLALGLSLSKANLWGTGVYNYNAIAALFCGIALVAAAQDCGREWEIWRRRPRGRA